MRPVRIETTMSVNTLRAKAGKARQKVATLVRQSQASTSDCVLVVFDKSEANIYFEGRSQFIKAPPST